MNIRGDHLLSGRGRGYFALLRYLVLLRQLDWQVVRRLCVADSKNVIAVISGFLESTL
jgi:hypothetical protein